MNAPPSRVFLVDDDPIMLCTFQAVLGSAGHRLEAFEHGELLLTRISAEDRGCIVIDLKLPGLNGLELHKALAERRVLLPVVFVSGQAEVPDAVAAMKQGAVDFLSKPIDPPELIAVVERALRRDAEAAAMRELREQSRARWETLTAREQAICKLLARGMVNKQVAAELNAAETTVHGQRGSAFKKLQVSTVVEVLRLLDRISEGGS